MADDDLLILLTYVFKSVTGRVPKDLALELALANYHQEYKL